MYAQCAQHCAAVHLVVYASARGSVRLSGSVAVCGSVRQCARLSGNAAVCGNAIGSVWQCARQCARSARSIVRQSAW
jgi:hypothetical protein